MLKTNKRNTLFKWAEEIEEYTSEKCISCGGPAHPATGFVLSLKEPEALLGMLKQPGKAIDMPYLIKELKLKGSQVQLITNVAREVLLEKPEIADNSELLTFVVFKRLKGE